MEIKGMNISSLWFPIHSTGEWGIRWLVFSLPCTPLNILKVKKVNRTLCFCLCIGSYPVFVGDRGVLATFEELNYILGLVSFLIMLILALTSNKDSHQQLKKNWKKLHRFAYAGGVLALFHVLLLGKGWKLYGILLGIGFLDRIPVVKTFLL